MPHSLAILLALLTPAQVPTRVDDIPPIELPRDHFYGAIAGRTGVVVRWKLDPAEVQLGESFTLTLVVENAVNPDELTPPPLLELPSYRELFSAVEDLPPDPTAGEATFAYRVTPRNEGEFHIPELTYRYYQPLAPANYRTLTTHARPVPFIVTKPAVSPSPPLAAPEEFFSIRRDGTFARSGEPRVWAWLGLFAGGGIACGLWVVVWLRLYPDAARSSRIRRNRAVRIALNQLRRKSLSPEVVATTFRNYLSARWGLAFTAQTPGEVAAGLAEVGMSAERAAEAEEVLRACDAARFAATFEKPVSAEAVAEMIERWEGV